MNSGISIFGSCVTRDAFEFDKGLLEQLRTYVARQKIVSAVSRPMKGVALDRLTTGSEWQKNALINDLTKQAFHLFSEDGSRYLIIDLVDERFLLARYKRGYYTYSTAWQNSNLSELLFSSRMCTVPIMKTFNRSYLSLLSRMHTVPVKRFHNRYYVRLIPLDRYIQQFCKKVREIYECGHVIINIAYMTDKYRNKNGALESFNADVLRSNERANDLLRYMYARLKVWLPDAYVLDLTKKYVADETHKWGLGSMHYEDAYYIDLISSVANYINGSK